MPTSDFLLAPCDRSAAAYAVEHWHYSARMPRGKLVCFGAWDTGKRFLGAVIFGHGAIPEIGEPYGLSQLEVCELVRVALRERQVAKTSAVVAAALRQLRRENPGLRLVVSYADSAEGHLGTIYQATNWLYAGSSVADSFRINGERIHGRSVNHRYGTKRLDWLRANVDPNVEVLRDLPKHRYLFPLDRGMRRRLATMSQHYPRAVEGSTGAAGLPTGGTGSIPVDRSPETLK